MKNLWKDRTNLRKKMMESRKQHFLDRLLSNSLSVEETEEIIEKVVHCNKVLFELKMYERDENLTKSE